MQLPPMERTNDDSPQKGRGRNSSATPDSPRLVRRPMLVRAGSVLLGVLAALILTEICLRVADIQPPRMQTKRFLVDESDRTVQYHCYPSNPHGEFEHLPDISRGRWSLKTYTFDPQDVALDRLEETPWCVKYEYSSKFIRDREYPRKPPDGVSRIAMVGDSFVFGEGVPIERTLPRQVEARLGKHYEVINAGVVGADTADEVRLLGQIVSEVECTRAIVVFIPNDIALTRQLLARQKYINDLIVLRDSYFDEHEARKWYAGHLRSLHILGSQFELNRVHRETIQWYLDSYDSSHNALNLQILANDLSTLAKIPNCRVAFVIYPLMEGFERGYPLKPIHQRVQAMARSAGLPVLDLAPVFDGKSTQELWVHPADRHPNGSAHELAAQAIVEWLEDQVPGFLVHDPSNMGLDPTP